jgi:hypothetical protein
MLELIKVREHVHDNFAAASAMGQYVKDSRYAS